MALFVMLLVFFVPFCLSLSSSPFIFIAITSDAVCQHIFSSFSCPPQKKNSAIDCHSFRENVGFEFNQGCIPIRAANRRRKKVEKAARELERGKESERERDRQTETDRQTEGERETDRNRKKHVTQGYNIIADR